MDTWVKNRLRNRTILGKSPLLIRNVSTVIQTCNLGSRGYANKRRHPECSSLKIDHYRVTCS